MRDSKSYFCITLLIFILSIYSLTAQEIIIHNLPNNYDFSSFEPRTWDKGGDNKIYIPVVFACLKSEYFYLNDKQILEFDRDWIDFIALDKSPDLFTAINYKGPYRVVVYNVQESRKEEFFKFYLID